MLKRFLIICTTSLFICLVGNAQDKRIHLNGIAQGTTWQAIYYASDTIIRQHQIDSLLNKIDSILSIYKTYSEIVSFNNSARGIIANIHFINVVTLAAEVSSETGGLFDITIAPLVNAWGFGADGSTRAPRPSQIDSLLLCVGFEKIKIKGDSLIKAEPCVRIDVNGIAQGYTVDVMASLLENAGLKNYLVELGGELRVRGRKQPSGEKFQVGIESAEAAEDAFEIPLQKIISLHDGAVTTSGNYRKYVEHGGRRLSHIIDPRSGRPVENELISVTVFAANATTADAYDNALMLMGLKKALRFLRKHPHLKAHFIYKDGKGRIATKASRKLKVKS